MLAGGIGACSVGRVEEYIQPVLLYIYLGGEEFGLSEAHGPQTRNDNFLNRTLGGSGRDMHI